MSQKDVAYNSPLNVLTSRMSLLTAKASIIGRFVLDDPHQVTFMSSRKLAAACGTSEGSVVRFSKQLGYPGYAEFQSTLRASLSQAQTSPGTGENGQKNAPPFLEKQLKETHASLGELIHFLDMKPFRQLVNLIYKSRKVYVVGQASTYHYAAHMGWEISQIRSRVRFFEVHDPHLQTELAEAPRGAAIIFITDASCSRAMGHVCRVSTQMDLNVAVIAPHLPCPLAEFTSILLTYGDPGNQQKDASINMGFLISCICRLALSENVVLRTPSFSRSKFAIEDTLEQKDTLSIGMWAAPSSLDPSFAAGTRREWPLVNCIYNGLVKYQEGTWDIVPDLASSWTISKNKKQITFYLRKGVLFHRDYGEMTSEDIKYSIERSARGYFRTAMDFIKQVKIIDAHTVSLVLKEPNFHLFSSILPFIPGKIISRAAMEELGPVRFAFNPVGTGPYEFLSHSAADEIRLKRFESYWGEPAKMGSLLFSPLGEDQIKTRLKSGKTDIARLPFANFKFIKDLPNVAYDVNYGLDHWLAGINVTRPPFDDIRVRRAIRHAIDVEAIIRRAFGGVPERSYSPIPKGSVGFWEGAPRHEQNLTLARKLMKEALGNQKINATLLLMPSENDRIAGEILRENLGRIGIHVDFNIQTTDMFNEVARQGNFDLYLTFSSCPIDPAMILNWFRTGEDWNCSHWSNADYDTAIKKAAVAMDTKKREELLIKAQELIDQDCWAVWITNGSSIVLRQRHIDTGKLFPDGSLAPWLIRKK